MSKNNAWYLRLICKYIYIYYIIFNMLRHFIKLINH